MRVTDEMAAEYERLVENWAHPDTRAPEAIRDLLADREELWGEIQALVTARTENIAERDEALAESERLRRVVEAARDIDGQWRESGKGEAAVAQMRCLPIVSLLDLRLALASVDEEK